MGRKGASIWRVRESDVGQGRESVCGRSTGVRAKLEGSRMQKFTYHLHNVAMPAYHLDLRFPAW